MPYSTACCTPLSNFEAGLNYKDVRDPAVVVNFPLAGDEAVAFVAWTTTPWTLPSNIALPSNMAAMLDQLYGRTALVLCAPAKAARAQGKWHQGQLG